MRSRDRYLVHPSPLGLFLPWFTVNPSLQLATLFTGSQSQEVFFYLTCLSGCLPHPFLCLTLFCGSLSYPTSVSMFLLFCFIGSLLFRHRNTAARKSTAQHLGRLAEVMGSSHLLSGKNKLTERFIHAISCLAVDCALEVR